MPARSGPAPSWWAPRRRENRSSSGTFPSRGIGIAAELIGWLERWIDDVLQERARSHETHGDGAFDVVREEAQQRFDAGRIDDVSQAFIEALEQEERKEQARQEERKRRRRLHWLHWLHEAIRYDKLAFNGEAAAAKLRWMAETEHPENADAQARYLIDQAIEYYKEGDTKGDKRRAADCDCRLSRGPEDLDARAHADPVGDDAEQPRRRLAELGKRESGTERLLEAAKACREALKERGVPLDRAMKQNNLGTVLAALGEREPLSSASCRYFRGRVFLEVD